MFYNIFIHFQDLALFEPASRITEDDKTNNIKSSNILLKLALSDLNTLG